MATQENNTAWYNVYRTASLGLSIVFAIVGLIFLFIPDNVFFFFNSVSRFAGFPESPAQGFGLYQILAVGYMYLVTLLAYFMYKYPKTTFFPLLLINGKSASALISFYLFFFHLQSLLLLTNGIVDGTIALGVLILYRLSRGKQQ
jgi:hypothetical protein